MINATIRMISLSLLVVLLFAPSLIASGTLQVGYANVPYGAYQAGQGGEFTLRGLTGTPVFDPGAYSAATKNVGVAGSFQTFCIEDNEFISPYAAVYYFDITPNAVQGGAGGPHPDPVSKGTAYLYSQFASGSLAGYNYGPPESGREATALQLQHAIWMLEQEETWNESLAGVFLTAAVNHFGGIAEAMADSGGLYGVQALNLYADALHHSFVQDQLTIIPEPSTFALYGLGLVLIGGIVRRRQQQTRPE